MPQEPRKTLLIIDDDRLFSDVVVQYFEAEDLEILTASTAAEGRGIFSARHVDLVILDQKLPDEDGKRLCPDILNHNEQAKIIFCTAHPSFENAVDAVKLGAHDYLAKPFDLEELGLAVRTALKTLALERVAQIQSYKTAKEQAETVLIGTNHGLAEIRPLIDSAAATDAPVLITGETGTGKTLAARTIHFQGPDRASAFLSINCAALPEHLIEAELFGHVKGAFSGAISSRKGIFEMAEGGTLVLEEIGELPLHIQSKLLGVLDDKMIKRIGGQSLKPVNVRIMVTTNVDLERAVAEKTFRGDLYYRLSVIRIHLPPLRDRPQDIGRLCRRFMMELAPAADLVLEEKELAILKDYPWPGNVRELKNIMERSVILRQGNTLNPSRLIRTGPSLTSFPPKLRAPIPSPASDPNSTDDWAPLEAMEKKYIALALERFKHNHTRTAKALGVARSTLMRKIKRYRLESPSRFGRDDSKQDT